MLPRWSNTSKHWVFSVAAHEKMEEQLLSHLIKGPHMRHANCVIVAPVREGDTDEHRDASARRRILHKQKQLSRELLVQEHRTWKIRGEDDTRDLQIGRQEDACDKKHKPRFCPPEPGVEAEEVGDEQAAKEDRPAGDCTAEKVSESDELHATVCAPAPGVKPVVASLNKPCRPKKPEEEALGWKEYIVYINWDRAQRKSSELTTYHYFNPYKRLPALITAATVPEQRDEQDHTTIARLIVNAAHVSLADGQLKVDNGRLPPNNIGFMYGTPRLEQAGVLELLNAQYPRREDRASVPRQSVVDTVLRYYAGFQNGRAVEKLAATWCKEYAIVPDLLRKRQRCLRPEELRLQYPDEWRFHFKPLRSTPGTAWQRTYLSPEFLRQPLKECMRVSRKKFLVLCGLKEFGKTKWAQQWGPHLMFKGSHNPSMLHECMEEGDLRYILFDEIKLYVLLFSDFASATAPLPVQPEWKSM